jgi:hypothetical protein
MTSTPTTPTLTESVTAAVLELLQAGRPEVAEHLLASLQAVGPLTEEVAR